MKNILNRLVATIIVVGTVVALACCVFDFSTILTKKEVWQPEYDYISYDRMLLTDNTVLTLSGGQKLVVIDEIIFHAWILKNRSKVTIQQITAINHGVEGTTSSFAILYTEN